MTMKGKSIKPNITNIENPFNIYPSLNLLGFLSFLLIMRSIKTPIRNNNPIISKAPNDILIDLSFIKRLWGI